MKKYEKKAAGIIAQPENCQDDNLVDMFNLCCEADREIKALKEVLERCVIENTKRLYYRYLEVAGCGPAKIVNFKTYMNNIHLKGILIEHEELAILERQLGIT